jgi:hypothetical protein
MMIMMRSTTVTPWQAESSAPGLPLAVITGPGPGRPGAAGGGGVPVPVTQAAAALASDPASNALQVVS